MSADFLQETSQGSTWNIRSKKVDRDGVWKGDILDADIEELENLDTSESHVRRLDAKEVLTPQRVNIFSVADGTAKLFLNRKRIPRTHSKAGTTCKE